jgi:DNA-binding response OmpR family regulator
LVLIAEDNAELNDYLKTCLTQYNVLQAYNGKEALQLAQEQLPDLVLSDFMMPEMTGIELCSELKNADLTAHIPVVILTAKSAIESRVEGLAAGADDYLSKPFNQTELLVRIENLIGLRRALREKYETALQSVKPDSGNSGLNAKDQAFLERAEAIIEEHLDKSDFEVTDFCAAMHLSRAQAHRKIKALTNVSVSRFIRSYRLKRAVELMKTEGLIVKEAAYRVGFNSPNYFSKCFHEQFGIPPTQL